MALKTSELRPRYHYLSSYRIWDVIYWFSLVPLIETTPDCKRNQNMPKDKLPDTSDGIFDEKLSVPVPKERNVDKTLHGDTRCIDVPE